MPKYILIFIALLMSLIILAILSLPDRNLHVVFCDVGQGDAILVTHKTFQMLVDGGPDRKVLSCLGRHLPFWDRKIEMVILTHPQEDHIGGLVDVLRSYRVDLLGRPDVEASTGIWDALQNEITKRHIPSQTLRKGDRLRVADLLFDILGPSSPLGTGPSGDLNEYSIVGILSLSSFDTLLTGDIIPPAIPSFLEQVRPVEVLKVPHHGSKNGLTGELLDKSNPRLAVISAGRNNRFGHPHEEIIKMLREKDLKILRTDLDGEIEVVSDGEKWWIE